MIAVIVLISLTFLFTISAIVYGYKEYRFKQNRNLTARFIPANNDDDNNNNNNSRVIFNNDRSQNDVSRSYESALINSNLISQINEFRLPTYDEVINKK
jgi:hypothetical protein